MRREEFKMERQGLVQVGDTVELTERGTIGNYSYIIEPAVAMSGCYTTGNRIKSVKGVIQDIRQTDRGFYVIVELDE